MKYSAVIIFLSWRSVRHAMKGAVHEQFDSKLNCTILHTSKSEFLNCYFQCDWTNWQIPLYTQAYYPIRDVMVYFLFYAGGSTQTSLPGSGRYPGSSRWWAWPGVCPQLSASVFPWWSEMDHLERPLEPGSKQVSLTLVRSYEWPRNNECLWGELCREVTGSTVSQTFLWK